MEMETKTKTEAETETETERSGSRKVDKNKIWDEKNSMWCSKVIQAAAQHVQCSIKQVFSSHLNYLQGKRVVILQTTKESFNSFHLDDDSKFTLLTPVRLANKVEDKPFFRAADKQTKLPRSTCR